MRGNLASTRRRTVQAQSFDPLRQAALASLTLGQTRNAVSFSLYPGYPCAAARLPITPATRLRLESLYSKVYEEGNITRCDFLIIWHTTAGVLLRNEGITLNRAEALLQSCLPGK